VVADGMQGFPRRPPPVRLPGGKGAGLRQVERLGAAEPRAPEDVGDGAERPADAPRAERLERAGADAPDMPPADAQRGPGRIGGLLDGAFPIPLARAGRAHVDPLALRVVD